MRTPTWALCLLGVCLGLSPLAAQGTPVAKINQAGDFLDLERDGQTVREFLPVHRTVGARYFSAGVGLEERSAAYPPFPLKIVFTAGGKPFLSGVAVTIQPAKGGPALVIPREQVEGPWLFVDLAPGLYEIVARDGDHEQQLKGVKIESGKQRVLYFRWNQDHGVAGRLPAE